MFFTARDMYGNYIIRKSISRLKIFERILMVPETSWVMGTICDSYYWHIPGALYRAKIALQK
jgi:hypothetical protein